MKIGDVEIKWLGHSSFFVKNLLYPLNGFGVSNNSDSIVIKTDDRILKGKIYGRDRSNLRNINEIFRRYFKNLKIIVE